MTKLDSRLSSLTFPNASSADVEPVRRLIVLVPESEADPAPPARRVWELAKAFKGPILFLGLCTDRAREYELRRQIIAMSEMAQNGDSSAEIKIEFGKRWVDAVRSNFQEGDMIACFAEPRAEKPLNQVLESDLNATVHVLSGLSHIERWRADWKSAFAGWAGSIAIILGAFWFQVKVTQALGGWLQTVLIIISLIFELRLLWAWNHLTG